MSTATADVDFLKTIKEYSLKNENNQKEILEKIKKVRSTNPPVFHKNGINHFLARRAEALEILTSIYLRTLFKLPIIDKSIFDLKRILYIDKNNKVVKDQTELYENAKKEKLKTVKTSLFTYTQLTHWPKQAEKTEIAKYQGRRRWHYSKTKVIATLPPIPKKIENKINETMVLYHQALASVYKNPEVVDLLEGRLSILPLFGALWIPAAQNLSVTVEKQLIIPRFIDPALIFNFCDNYLLVDTWDIEEEEPYENYIREFSLGDLDKKLKKGKK